MKFSKTLGIAAAAVLSSSALASGMGETDLANAFQGGIRAASVQATSLSRARQLQGALGAAAQIRSASLLDFPVINMAYQLMFGQDSDKGQKSWRVTGTIGVLKNDYVVSMPAPRSVAFRGVFAGQSIDVGAAPAGAAGGRYASNKGSGWSVSADVNGVPGGFTLSGTVGGVPFNEELALNPLAALGGEIYSVDGSIGGIKFTQSAKTDSSALLIIDGKIGSDDISVKFSQEKKGSVHITGSFGPAAVDETVTPIK